MRPNLAEAEKGLHQFVQPPLAWSFQRPVSVVHVSRDRSGICRYHSRRDRGIGDCHPDRSASDETTPSGHGRDTTRIARRADARTRDRR